MQVSTRSRDKTINSLRFSSSFVKLSLFLSKSKNASGMASAVGSSSGSWYGSKYGCLRASSTVIRFTGLKARSFSKRSRARSEVLGNMAFIGIFFLKGRERMYSRARRDLMP